MSCTTTIDKPEIDRLEVEGPEDLEEHVRRLVATHGGFYSVEISHMNTKNVDF